MLDKATLDGNPSSQKLELPGGSSEAGLAQGKREIYCQIVQGCVMLPDARQAHEVLARMAADGLGIDEAALCSVLSACRNLQDPEAALKVLCLAQSRGFSLCAPSSQRAVGLAASACCSDKAAGQALLGLLIEHGCTQDPPYATLVHHWQHQSSSLIPEVLQAVREHQVAISSTTHFVAAAAVVRSLSTQPSSVLPRDDITSPEASTDLMMYGAGLLAVPVDGQKGPPQEGAYLSLLRACVAEEAALSDDIAAARRGGALHIWRQLVGPFSADDMTRLASRSCVPGTDDTQAEVLQALRRLEFLREAGESVSSGAYNSLLRACAKVQLQDQVETILNWMEADDAELHESSLSLVFANAYQQTEPQ